MWRLMTSALARPERLYQRSAEFCPLLSPMHQPGPLRRGKAQTCLSFRRGALAKIRGGLGQQPGRRARDEAGCVGPGFAIPRDASEMADGLLRAATPRGRDNGLTSHLLQASFATGDVGAQFEQRCSAGCRQSGSGNSYAVGRWP